MNKLTTNNRYELVLVCGAYKTGTSLAIHLLEQEGYFNPANFNNHHEHGNGLSQRYLTKECSASRKTNREILYSVNTPNFDDILTLANLKSTFRDTHFNTVLQLISELPSGTVIKDPQFTYTLYYWLKACQSLKKRVKVYFTDRPKDDLVTAWNEAYFTKSLLSKNSSALMNMTVMAQLYTGVCANMNIPFEIFDIRELKNSYQL